MALATEGIHSPGAGCYAEAEIHGPDEIVSGVVGSEEVHAVVRYPLNEPIPKEVRKNSDLLYRVAFRLLGPDGAQDRKSIPNSSFKGSAD